MALFRRRKTCFQLMSKAAEEWRVWELEVSKSLSYPVPTVNAFTEERDNGRATESRRCLSTAHGFDVNKFGHQSRLAYSTAGVSLPSSKSLWDIMKKSLVEGHDAKHVQDIWMEYHADPKKQRVATSIPKAMYDRFCETGTMTPMFVLPVFRGPNAFETFVMQCQSPLVLFTSLEDFKRHGSDAAPHFVVTHYTELASSHGIVLVRGDIIQPQALDQLQALSLMKNGHDFFSDFGSKRAFVHAFNRKPEEFDFKKMLDSLGHATDRLPM